MPSDHPETFCNPLSLPNYPLGRGARDIRPGDPVPISDHTWLSETYEQFRELADPSALYENGRWYLYPSVDMAWESADNGGTWHHRPLNVRDLGYAPTIVKHGSRFLLMASHSSVYTADSPLGEFAELGPVLFRPDGKAPPLIDPMLFSDEGRLYLYWGRTPNGGIWGVELDAADPTRVVGEPAEMIFFQPDLHPWERLGDWNQNPNIGWLEGAWMLKQNGKYYLTYSAGGTENRTYAMGCYTGDSPLGPFAPQKLNPILRSPDGLITGTGHGCVVAGPGGELWAFYTVRAGISYIFERRVGMDRAEINADGELVVKGATELPQWVPGAKSAMAGAETTGWLPLNGGMKTYASTSAPNFSGAAAVDNELRTWWQPAEGDAQPTLTSYFTGPATIRAIRLVWRDVGLDTTAGIDAGPFCYRVEAEVAPDRWEVVLDRTASTQDLLVDYRECAPTTGSKARLVITGWPKGITPGVCEFTVFGMTNVATPLP